MSTGDNRAPDETETTFDQSLTDRGGRGAPLERVTTQTITESYVVIDHRVVRRDGAAGSADDD